jgi:small subunit ribosomal protein S16
MLTIRLTRVGKKNNPSFRVIVVESKRKVKTGNYLEMVGSYDPKVDRVDLKADRIKHWLSMGATVSDTVHNLLVSNKIINAKKINILPSFKAAPVVEAPVAESAPEAPAETPAEAPAEEAKTEEPKEDNSVAEETPAA